MFRSELIIPATHTTEPIIISFNIVLKKCIANRSLANNNETFKFANFRIECIM